jgi:hypothetical protein
VDNGWLSVNRQRSVCERCAGHLRCLGYMDLMVWRLRGPLCVPYPNDVDEMRRRAVTSKPGPTAGFDGRAGSGTEHKIQERTICQYLYDGAEQSTSVCEPCRLARCAAPFRRVRHERQLMKKTARSRLCVGLTFSEYRAHPVSASDQSFTAAISIVPDTT